MPAAASTAPITIPAIAPPDKESLPWSARMYLRLKTESVIRVAPDIVDAGRYALLSLETHGVSAPITVVYTE